MANREEEIIARLQRIELALLGDGINVQGLVPRVATLERAEDGRRWTVRTAVGAAIGSVVAALFAWFGAGGHH